MIKDFLIYINPNLVYAGMMIGIVAYGGSPRFYRVIVAALRNVIW